MSLKKPWSVGGRKVETGNMVAYRVVLMHHTVNGQWSVGGSLGGNMAAYTVALMHHTVNGQWSVGGSLW